MNVANVIKDNTRRHLVYNNGQLYCQNVTAVGWVGGTVPDDVPDNKGIIELSTSDSSNSGIVCGAALAGRKPIYVIRYQGFMTYNSASILNYACKSKEMWDTPCPVFVRSIGMEGCIGPVATGMHHSMAVRMPGIKVFAPMTPNEWQETWDYFLEHEDIIYCSEHRKSFVIDKDIESFYSQDPDICIIGVGAARLEVEKAAEILSKDYQVHTINQFKVKPLTISEEDLESIRKSDICVVVDSDYKMCGVSEHICYTLMSLDINKNCHAMALEDRTAGFSESTDNLTPNYNQIIKYVRSEL